MTKEQDKMEFMKACVFVAIFFATASILGTFLELVLDLTTLLTNMLIILFMLVFIVIGIVGLVGVINFANDTHVLKKDFPVKEVTKVG